MGNGHRTHAVGTLETQVVEVPGWCGGAVKATYLAGSSQASYSASTPLDIGRSGFVMPIFGQRCRGSTRVWPIVGY